MPNEVTAPRLRDHTLYRRIGQGSSGEVWLATDAMNKWRAVKIVWREVDGRNQRGYDREFDAIKRYEEICRSDPSLMPILAVGRDPAGRYFFYSMDLADDAESNCRPPEIVDDASGEVAAWVEAYRPRTLRSELRRRGRFSPAECVEIGTALTIALEQLHEHGLIHRDIKPDNIIFVYGQPKLADVGLVADADAAYSLAGTLAYLSPEAERKQPADIFALGKVLYEMATGRDADEFPHLPRDFERFTDEERSQFNELNAIILKACAQDAGRRHNSARHLREELEWLKDNRSVLRLRVLEQRDHRRREFIRRLVATSVALAVLLVITVLGAFAWMTRQRAAEESWRRELREMRIARFVHRQAGWSAENWARIERLAAVNLHADVVEQATAALTGIDAREVVTYRDLPAGAAAFGPDGTALVSGVGNSAPMLIDARGVRRELPWRGEGPVTWTVEGVPVQFTAISNRFFLREARRGEILRELQPPRRENPPMISSPPILALSGKATLAAVALRDRIVVWNGATGGTMGEIALSATALAVSQDDSLLAAGQQNGVTHVYRVSDLSGIASLEAPLRGSPITCLAFSPNPVVRHELGRSRKSWLLASGNLGAAIVIWDLDRRAPRSFCLGSPWTVRALAFHPDGLILASAGRNEARLWDALSGQLLLRLGGASSGASHALAFDMEGKHLIYGGEVGFGRPAVSLWELERNRGIRVFRGLASAARKLWFSPDGRLLASLSDDWHLAIWRTDNARAVYIFEAPVGGTADNAGGCFDPAAKYFAFATGTQACLYDLATGGIEQQWALPAGKSDQLCFDRHGRLLLLRREPRPIRRHDWRLYHLAESGEPILIHEQHDQTWTARDMRFGAGGERFFVWNGDSDTNRFILEYDSETGREVRKFDAEFASDLHVVLDPSGRWLVYSAFADRSKWLMVDLADGRRQTLGEGTFVPRAVCPAGAQFASEGFFHPDLARLDRAIPIGTDWSPGQYVWSFSPDGKLLAGATYEGPVLVADIQEVRRRLAALSAR